MILWEVESSRGPLRLQLKAVRGEGVGRFSAQITYWVKVILNGHETNYYRRDFVRWREYEYTVRNRIREIFSWINQTTIMDELIRESFNQGTASLGNEVSATQSIRDNQMLRDEFAEEMRRRWVNDGMDRINRFSELDVTAL